MPSTHAAAPDLAPEVTGRPWLARTPVRTGTTLRVLCLPYAGGSAAVYRDWQRHLPAGVEVCAVELPGHGARIGERPARRLLPLVREMVTGLAGLLHEPYSVFGHSLGGLLAYELVRTARERGLPAPVHLFLSAVAAPGTPPTRPAVRDATDDELRAELVALNGTPAELLRSAELMALMLPVLRADFSVLETYECAPGAPLDVPVSLFAGSHDTVVPTSSMSPWSGRFDRAPRVRLFPGDHFFLSADGGAVARAVGDTLAGTVPAGPVPAGRPVPGRQERR